MGEVRKTFEHLVVIFGITLLVVLLVLSIPGPRQWVFEETPRILGNIVGTRAMSRALVGVDPQLLAQAVNDEDTREDLVAVWKSSVPEMETAALAEMLNELTADPNFAAMIVDVVSQLDDKAIADLSNKILSDPALAHQVVSLIPRLDTPAISSLINTVLASEGSSDHVRELISTLDPQGLGDFVNRVISEDTGEMSKFIVELLDTGLDTGPVAGLLSEVLDQPETGDWIGGLLDKVDPVALGGLIDSLVEGLTDPVSNMDPKIAADMLGQLIRHLIINEDLGLFLEDVLEEIAGIEEVVETLLGSEETGQLKPLLFGDYDDNHDGVLDNLWLRIKLERLAIGDLTYDTSGLQELLGQTLSEEVAEAIAVLIDDMIKDMEIWAKLTDLAYQEEVPFRTNGTP